MPPRACLSPRPGVRRRKDDSERAVWRSGRPSRPARIRPNPPNPGRMARFPGKTPLQSAVEAVRIPSPYLHPSGKPAPDRPSNTPPKVPPPKVPSLDEDPLEPLDFKPVTRPPAPLWTSAPLQGDRHAPESVIGMAELVIGIGGIRNHVQASHTVPRRCCLRPVRGDAFPPDPFGGSEVAGQRPSAASVPCWKVDQPMALRKSQLRAPLRVLGHHGPSGRGIGPGTGVDRAACDPTAAPVHSSSRRRTS